MPPKKDASAAPANDADIAKKLQPIYDALDSNNNKSAIKLLTPALAKYGRRPLLLTLWALALARLDQKSEAQRLCDEVAVMKPIDTHLLSTLSLVHKSLGTQSKMTSLWQLASLSNPTNEATMLALFYSYVRDHNYSEAQTVAMKLYTSFKRDTWLYYNAVNQLLLHYHSADAPNRMLQLAEMMIKRAVTPKLKPYEGLETEDFKLLLSLLVKQANYTEAESMLRSGLAARYTVNHNQEYRLDVLAVYGKLGWTEQRIELLRALCLDYECDWQYCCQWLDDEFTQWRSQSKSPMTQHKIDSLYGFVRRLQDRYTDNNDRPLTRNPYLAEIELSWRLALQHDMLQPTASNSENISDSNDSRIKLLFEAFLNYHREFGTKLCFFNDCQKYLQSLPTALRKKLSAEMKVIAGDEPVDSTLPSGTSTDIDTLKSLSNRLLLLLSYHQCHYFCGMTEPMTVSELESQARLYFRLYLLSLLASKLPLSSTERGNGDNYLLLFASVCNRLNSKTKNANYNFTALLLLEHALKYWSPNNYDLKVYCIRLHCRSDFAGVQRSIELYQSLDVKQIQLESLVHLIVYDCQRYGDYQSLTTFSNKLLSVHSSYERDEGSLWQSAYDAKTWSKLIELFEMRQRMTGSAMKLVCRTMDQMAAMMLSAGNIQIITTIANTATNTIINSNSDSTLIVNSDYDFIACYEPLQSSFHSYLHRPAPSHLAADTITQSSSQRLLDDSYPFEGSYQHSHQLQSSFIRLLNYLIHSDQTLLRKELEVFKSALGATPSPLIDFHSLGTKGGVASVESQIWQLTFLIAETGASVVETIPVTEAVINGTATATVRNISSNGYSIDGEEVVMQDHLLRWGSLHRQLTVLAELTNAIGHAFSSTQQFELVPSLAAMVIDGTRSNERPVSIDTLRQVTLFLSYPCLMLSTAIQCWIRDLPNKKTAKKKKGTSDGNISARVWLAIIEVHESLAQLIAVYKHSLIGVSAMIKTLVSAPLPFEPSFPFTAQCAAMLAQVGELRSKSLSTSANGSDSGNGSESPLHLGDLDTAHSTLCATLIASHQATGASLQSIIDALLSVVNHVKS